MEAHCGSFPPRGRSINDSIKQEWCSLSYTRVEDVVARLLELGPGALNAKLDVKSAYRIVPVHPDNRRLLGTKWMTRFLSRLH